MATLAPTVWCLQVFFPPLVFVNDGVARLGGGFGVFGLSLISMLLPLCFECERVCAKRVCVVCKCANTPSIVDAIIYSSTRNLLVENSPRTSRGLVTTG